MKVLKVIGLLIVLVIIGILGYYFYLRNSLTPSYSGTQEISSLSEEVAIYFTEHGVPHIYGKSQEDTYRALGYMHAMERLWQIDLLRHVGSGRLSELFGPDMVKNDIFLRTMGMSQYARESANNYLQRSNETTAIVQAYVEGINAYIEQNPKPLEHTILGVDVEPFEVQNIFEILTYMAFSFSNAHITDPILTELSAKLDSSYLDDLSIYHYKGESTLRSFDARFSDYSANVVEMMNEVGVPEFIGSNSWVISPAKSETGKVILTNDPHIGFAQPSVWYESHLNSPETEYYGYHIPGTPFPLLMHSESHATGLTMFENDDMDFYVEEIHPEDSMLYRHDDQWKTMEAQEEVIQIKGEDPVTFTIRSTVHGPVVSDILMEDPLDEVVTVFWVTTRFPNFMVEAIHGMVSAQNIDEVEEAAASIHGPGLNVMYGDSSGNVAWWAVSKLIKREDERTSKTFYDGSDSTYDPDEFYPFEKNPHAINPSWNYVHSANNQPDTVDGVLYSGYYLPDDRGERIVQLLDADTSVSIQKMKDMLMDDQSVMTNAIKGIMLHAIKDTPRGDLLRDLISWDGTFDRDDYRPLIFQKWMHETLKAAQYDEIGEDLWGMYKRTHTYKVAIENLFQNETSRWWDNDTTEVIEDRATIMQQAFETAMEQLETQWGPDYQTWTWGDAHPLKHNHAMGEVIDFLNVGPFPVSGGNEVLNNMGYTYTEDPTQIIRFGPSTRRVVDFSDVRNNSWSILPTGQSGNYFSPYYDDQASMYANGEFRKMIMNHQIIKESTNVLSLTPAK